MTPSPDTLAVLLALPLEARRALCEAEGPGWVVSRWQTERSVEVRGAPYGIDVYPDAPHADQAWLPASELEILRVWDDRYDKAGDYYLDDAWTSPYDARLRAALECCPRDVGRSCP